MNIRLRARPTESVHPLELAGFFGAAILVRVVFILAASLWTGWPVLDLSMLYDGHGYLIVAKSFPTLYQHTAELVPFVTLFRDPRFFLGTFPFFPALTWVTSGVLGDLRTSGLVVAQLSAALTVVRFRSEAQDLSSRPRFAALLFLVFPATWLVASSLAFSEPVMLLGVVSGFAAYRRGHLWSAAVWLGCACVTQKHGVLMLPILFLTHFVRYGWRRLPDLAPLALSLIPLAGLQTYLYIYFGDPFANLASFWAFAGPGPGWPFAAIVQGALSLGQIFEDHFWLRKGMLICSILFYGGVLALALRRPRAETVGLLIWLGVTFAFCVCLSGNWAFFGFPRYMLLAAPPTLLLFSEQCPLPSSRFVASVFGALLLSLVFAAALTDVASARQFCERVWSPIYFHQLVPLLR
ncbi:MAG TPA: hypothetical protein VK714_16920 [Myxococcota bacterium]|nr:hypothetical protein [Myxococcota bacterium]